MILRLPLPNLNFHTCILWLQDLQVTLKKAAKYLHALCDAGFLSEIKIGKEIYFLNDELFQLLANVSSLKVE